ncbi:MULTISPECIES: hypothetical protein [Aquimarina]|uniref:hypothetical protein n=1 Tax=Aquimarina TaxID=290174 RepID=UPI000D69E7A4|nr:MULTISPECIES: hypothetical protein [Aquimarina]
MKKKLEAELISIAHRILQLKDKTTLPQLQEEARILYEKLTILNFSETHFAGPQPTIGQIKTALDTDESEALKEVRQKIKAIIEPEPVVTETIEEKPELDQPPVQVENQEQEKKEDISALEHKPELVIEEINARVTEDLFVPATTPTEEHSSFSDASSSQSAYEKNDREESISTIGSDPFDKIDDDKPKSLNDQLRKEIHIGLNDRLAFIKYLFEGSASDYNRVLSQLSTLRNKSEAEEFIANMIKPDYHNWEGKDEYEERFMDVVLGKFDH